MADKNLYIQHSCFIRAGKVVVDQSQIEQEEDGEHLKAFLKRLYKSRETDYSKFHKMDALCKLAFMASEYVLEGVDWKSEIPAEDFAIVLQNRSSSYDSDLEHADSIQREGGIASPAVFVYTLPNIMIGEIAIRNGIKGENACFITDAFNSELLVDQVEDAFAEGSKLVLTGWVEQAAEDYEAFFFLVGQQSQAEKKQWTVDNVKGLLHEPF